MKIKLSPKQVFAILRIVVQAIKAVGVEIKEAKAPEGPGGVKVTFPEAVEIVSAAFASAVEPVAEVIADED